MIKLKEILHRLKEEESEGLTDLDNWKITDYDFMTDMDFKPDGMYHFALRKPHMKVAHKKGVGFILDDYSKTNQSSDDKGAAGYDNMPHGEEDNKPVRQVFPTFKELSDHFTKYEQKWENEPYKS